MISPHTRLVVCLTVSGALASAIFIPSFLRIGTCADLQHQPNFDLNKFSGLWYVILQVPNELIPITRCMTSNYTLVQQDGRFINNREGLASNGTLMSTLAELRIANDGQHSFFLTMEDFSPEIGVRIAETDYENYACVYSCLQRLIFKAEIVIIMSRLPTIKKTHVELCKSVITDRSAFSWSNLRSMEQGESCPYWPDHMATVSEKLSAKTSISDMVGKIDEGVHALIEKSAEEDEEMQDFIFFEPTSAAWKNTSSFSTVILGMLSVLILCCSF